MTDDLNIQNKPMSSGVNENNPDDNEPITEPSQKSPLEENAGSVGGSDSTIDNSLTNQVTSSEMSPPIATDSNSPLAQQAEPAPLEAVAQPEVENQQPPSEAPDTDQFLKSILDDKTGLVDSDSSLGTQTSDTSIQPLQSEVSLEPGLSNQVTEPIQPQVQPQANDLLKQAEEIQQQPQSSEQPMQPDAPSLASAQTQQSKIKDEVSLDGIVSNQGENHVSSDIFSNPNSTQVAKKKDSPKLLLLALLGLIIVVGGYVAYKQFFPTVSTPTLVTQDNFAPVSETPAPILTKDQQRKSDLLSIQQALLNYRSASGKYPISETLTFLNTPGNSIEKELVPTYLNILPTDPDLAKNYAYRSDGNTFTITAVLDDLTDPEGVTESSMFLYKVTEQTVASSSPSSLIIDETIQTNSPMEAGSGEALPEVNF